MSSPDANIASLSTLRQFMPDPGFKPFLGPQALAGAVRAAHPGGVNAILIGLMPVSGFKIARQDNGIIAILIGLLLPAVQRLRMPNAPELQQLRSLLSPGGSIGIAMGDGSVRLLAGPPLNFSALR